jgi:type II secretory pathway component PulF
MKKFHYKAKKGPREVVEGVLYAESPDQAMDKIHEMGLIAVDLGEDKSAAHNAISIFDTFHRVGSKEMCQFYRQFASLVKAGVPVIKALAFLARETTHPMMKEVILGLESSVRGGQSLYAALAKYPKVFSQFDRGMIQTGESGGKMEEALMKIAQCRTNQEIFRMKVRTALAYPLFVIIVGVVGVFYMLASVVPQFSGFFANLGQQLPLPTRILITVGEWMRWGWAPILMLILGLVFFVRKSLENPEKKAAWDIWVAGLPLIGSVVIKSEIANLSRSLSLLLKSGIPILSAIRAVIPIVMNEAIKRDLEKVYASLEQGGFLSRGLEASKLFPPFFVQIVSVGEESGRLDDALNEVADWYELETSQTIQTMTSLMEPALILIVAVMMGAMMIAILLPIFSMSTMVS